MSCERIEAGAYALGLLEDRDRRDFEEHLRACPLCRAELADLAGTAEALTELKGISPGSVGARPRSGSR